MYVYVQLSLLYFKALYSTLNNQGNLEWTKLTLFQSDKSSYFKKANKIIN